MTTQPQSPSPCPSNPSILEALIARHGAELRAQAARHAPSAADIDDALQDGCVEFLRYYKGPSGNDALRYLMVAVKQRAWAIRAAGRRRPQLAIGPTDLRDDPEALAVPDGRPGPSALAERHQEHAERCDALGQLRPDQRTALALLAAGFSYREIGERRNWSYSKVNRSIAEGRAALRNAA